MARRIHSMGNANPNFDAVMDDAKSIKVPTPVVPGYSTLLKHEKGISKMGWKTLVNIPWPLKLESVVKELHQWNEDSSRRRKSGLRCDYNHWKLEDFRRIFNMPEKGDMLAVRAQPQRYTHMFTSDYSSGNGWRIKHCKDEEMRVLLSLVCPLLHPGHAQRVMVNEVKGVYEQLNDKAIIDWGAVLFNALVKQAKDATTEDKSFQLGPLLTYFYRGLGLLTEKEENARSLAERALFMTVYEDEHPDPESSEDTEGENDEEDKAFSQPKKNKVARKRSSMDSEVLVLSDDEPEMLSVGKRGKSLAKKPFTRLSNARLASNEGKPSDSEQIRDIFDAYFERQIQKEEAIRATLEAAGVETPKDLVEFVKDVSYGKDLESKLETERQKHRNTANDIEKLKEQANTARQLVYDHLKEWPGHWEEIKHRLAQLIEWKETFASDTRAKLKSEHKTRVESLASGATSPDLGTMAREYCSSLEEQKAEVTRFDDVVKRLEALMPVLRQLSGYYGTLDDAKEPQGELKPDSESASEDED